MATQRVAVSPFPRKPLPYLFMQRQVNMNNIRRMIVVQVSGKPGDIGRVLPADFK
jgi:hypothetical protein